MHGWKTLVDMTGSLIALPYRPGTPFEVILACRSAIIMAALPDGAIRIDAASAGKGTKVRGGGWAAPITARIVYSRDGEVQIRQAAVSCRMNADGQVVALR